MLKAKCPAEEQSRLAELNAHYDHQEGHRTHYRNVT